MCLWLLTACLGLLPTNPSPAIVVVSSGVPAPILLPTAAPTTAPTGAPTMTPTRPPTISPSTMPPAPPVTTAAPPPATTAPTTTRAPPPTTGAPPPTTGAPPPTTGAPPPTTGAPPPTTGAPPPTTGAPPPTTTPPPTTAGPPPMTTTTLGGVLLPVILCLNPDVVCISNPDDETDTGPPPIDPRLGTTPAASAALQAPLITGYSAQVPPYDTAVKFPRQRRSIETDSGTRTNKFYQRSENRTSIKKHVIRKRQSCTCVPAGTCPGGSTSGAGMIDVRIVTPGATQCPAGQVYCCTGQTTTPITCGRLQTVPPTVVAPAAGQASFGEYPWQALILTKQNDYIAGGVLIDQLNVITVIHRLTPYIVSGTAPNVKVRMGEWDAAGTYEPVPFQEYNVLKVFSHPSYNPSTLQYDIMVMRLSAPVPFTPAAGSATTINRACLPPSATTAYTGQRCWVSGWGKDMFGLQGQYQQILKKVDVPIVAPATCQSQLQAARLGATFVLDTTSFICAGGEANKDACTGDGGSGLVCLVNGQWVVVGLVAWGLGCAMTNVPAAYVNVAALLPWIQQQVATP